MVDYINLDTLDSPKDEELLPTPIKAHRHKEGESRKIHMDVEEMRLMQQELTGEVDNA